MPWFGPLFWKRFRQQGIVGINSRNLDAVLPLNRRKLFPLVDDKIQTKAIALRANIPCPKQLGVIAYQQQISQLEQMIADCPRGFVIKPSNGSGGNGILVLDQKTPTGYKKSSGVLIDQAEVAFHISNILSGMYSLGGQPDTALIEEKVDFDPVFSDITYMGVPDIRVLVYRGIPAMAMLRLPTRASDGKANLHRGGIGVGVDLATGTTQSGVWKDQYVDQHPETGHSLSGRVIPQWQTILAMATQFYAEVPLGYLGIDVVLDRERGPLMIEANARPGISIQVANRRGLNHAFAEINQRLAEGDKPGVSVPALLT